MNATKCETCNGSGMVAIGPWGSRPQRKACDDCLGAGFMIAPRDARLDARMLDDLREWRRRLGIVPDRHMATITIEEFDLLLSIADERDALKRELDAERHEPTPVPLPSNVTRPMPIVEISIEADELNEIRDELADATAYRIYLHHAFPDEEPHKTWPCLWCGDPIRRRVDPSLGTPFYEHVESGSDHNAVRGPMVQAVVLCRSCSMPNGRHWDTCPNRPLPFPEVGHYVPGDHA